MICPYCRRAVPRGDYTGHARTEHQWNIYLLDDGRPRNPIEMESSRARRGAGGSEAQLEFPGEQSADPQSFD